LNALTIAISVFVVLESLNIILLYFFPFSRKGNAPGIFNALEESKKYPEIHQLIRYLINWVAGTKLIFAMLLVVILISGSYQTKLYAVIALIISILSFFWRLFPSISKMDKQGEITPKGYSKQLFWMITSFILGFSIAIVLALIAR
jgi:hypothetical protein